MKVYSEKIKSLRENAFLSRNKLSRLSGLSTAYISKIERGFYDNISIKTCQKLADGLNITLFHFLYTIGLLNNNKVTVKKLLVSALSSDNFNSKQISEILNYINYIKNKE